MKELVDEDSVVTMTSLPHESNKSRLAQRKRTRSRDPKPPVDAQAAMRESNALRLGGGLIVQGKAQAMGERRQTTLRATTSRPRRSNGKQPVKAS